MSISNKLSLSATVGLDARGQVGPTSPAWAQASSSGPHTCLKEKKRKSSVEACQESITHTNNVVTDESIISWDPHGGPGPTLCATRFGAFAL